MQSVYRASNKAGICRVIFVVGAMAIAIIIFTSFSSAMNAIDLTAGSGDTIWGATPAKIVIWIENDVLVKGISMGYMLFSPDGAIWTYIDVGGYSSFPSGPRFVKGVPGSRWTKPCAAPDCWDLASPRVDFNGIPDQFMISAAALACGLTPGPLEAMLEVHLTVHCPPDDEIYHLCMDSAFFPPYGDFVFQPGGVPAVLWPQGGKCWPVKRGMPGDANESGNVDVGDAVFLCYYIFRGGPSPGILRSGDPNGDCVVNAGDVVYLVNYIFRNGSPPQPGCAK
jgi:Dockerin type I domain